MHIRRVDATIALLFYKLPSLEYSVIAAENGLRHPVSMKSCQEFDEQKILYKAHRTNIKMSGSQMDIDSVYMTAVCFIFLGLIDLLLPFLVLEDTAFWGWTLSPHNS
jgi:hypothetical protein